MTPLTSTAEYARVPFADDSLLVIPSTPHNDLDFVLLSDIFPTAWGGLSMSGFQPGDVVVVFGAGPVGLLVAYSAILRGAAKVYSIDHVQARLDKAQSIGAIPIDLAFTDPKKGIKGPADQILAHEPLGVNRVVDAIGFECVNTDLKPQADFVLREATSVAGFGAGIYLIGVYNSGPKDAGEPRADTIPNELSFDMNLFWNKNLTIRGGGVFPAQWIPEILPLMESGRAKPSFVFSDEIGIDDVPDGYKKFDAHEATKIAIRFPWEFEQDASLKTQNGKKRTASEARLSEENDEASESRHVHGRLNKMARHAGIRACGGKPASTRLRASRWRK
jgi:threonine dehydrogenase-like Zn-dependent dehydrogenase